MSKKTTSDLLKDFMAGHPQIGGNINEWKRLSKKKDEEGRWVREFKNAATGQALTVIEIAPNRFAIGGDIARIEKSYFPAMNSDPAKEKLAQGLISEILDDEGECDIFSDEIAARVRRAGTAFANQFCFAYCSDPDLGGAWIISPLETWGKDNCVYDQPMPLHALLPGEADDVNECGTWVVEPAMEPLEGTLELMRRGFIWDAAFQASVDSSQTELIEKIAAGREAQLTAQSQPKPPAL